MRVTSEHLLVHYISYCWNQYSRNLLYVNMNIIVVLHFKFISL